MLIDRRSKPTRPFYLELTDTSINRYRASQVFTSVNASDFKTTLATFSHQLIKQNADIFSLFNIKAHVEFNGRDVSLSLTTGSIVGALPLKSPISGRSEISLIVKPRFNWNGIGLMMTEMGWKVNPEILKLPLLPETERSIPNWIIAATVLFRISELLKSTSRKFAFISEYLQAPQGMVNWTHYAQQKVPRLDLLQIPCTFPTLADDHKLKSAIHYTLRKLLGSLESQRQSGIVVLKMIDFCKVLIEQVQYYQPIPPTKNYLSNLQQSITRTNSFKEGVEAIEWTINDLGLAGLGDLQGLPWIMNMNSLFEGWIESIFQRVAFQGGWTIRAGRKRETLTPVIWQQYSTGAQKYLLPDVILERGSEVVIVDAKYKSHWEELNMSSWSSVEQELRENHRNDFLQILAYSTLFENKKIKCYLVYPCKSDTYNSLRERNKLFNKGTIYAGSREIEICLTATPIGNQSKQITQDIAFSLSES